MSRDIVSLIFQYLQYFRFCNISCSNCYKYIISCLAFSSVAKLLCLPLGFMYRVLHSHSRPSCISFLIWELLKHFLVCVRLCWFICLSFFVLSLWSFNLSRGWTLVMGSVCNLSIAVGLYCNSDSEGSSSRVLKKFVSVK